MSNSDISPTPLSSAAQSSVYPSTSVMAPKSLTLILAATPSLGIGKGGGLPWPQLKKEMGYFARVTKRTTATEGDAAGAAPAKRQRVNAVVMGRKTWDSIPDKFRPLKGRINVVVTRSVDAFTSALPPHAQSAAAYEGPLVAGSVSDALSQLQSDKIGVEVDKVIVIGGASIYEQALQLQEAKHVLLTKIQKEYECDTYFSENLEGDGWTKASREELQEFTGETFEEGTEVEEKDVKFEFCLYNRIR
ncbi:dihydrofolate reductase-like domain-containing protein [Boeremia exigua]|uniref:dihydrofolate reductase-like domain-containing protein n=1 Tax=Boeremia exigua TaxID=749465 RepID=UPI001E8D2520|nr:dihydrofolate reductase-like domain-containing protein [Boeremia exigua]KAH6625637.1 dihydrofolate reductase-like domain-containing protein [Boeremia exigua]